MRKVMRGLLMLAMLFAVAVVPARAEEEKGGTVENPMYAFWAKFKPGATVTLVEKTKYHGAEKESVPDGTDHKTVNYRLLNVNKKQAVVLTTVVEEGFLGTVE